MPIYEYKCETCGYRFSLLEPVSTDDSTRTCPKCQSEDVKRVISSFSLGRLFGNSDDCKPGG